MAIYSLFRRLFHIARLVDQRAQKLICASSKWFQSYFWTPVSDLASRKVIQDWLWTAILLPVLYIRPFYYHIAWQHCFASPHLLVSLQLLLFIPSKRTKNIHKTHQRAFPPAQPKWQVTNWQSLVRQWSSGGAKTPWLNPGFSLHQRTPNVSWRQKKLCKSASLQELPRMMFYPHKF